MPLDQDVLDALRDTPRNYAARQLLTGGVGPLVGVGFRADIAEAAYLAWCAYNMSVGGGMLKGRPTYEATGTMASRIRNAALRASSCESWANELMRSLNLRVDRLTAADQRWWREFCAADGPDRLLWRRLKTPDAMQEVASAVALMASEKWMSELKKDGETA